MELHAKKKKYQLPETAREEKKIIFALFAFVRQIMTA